MLYIIYHRTEYLDYIFDGINDRTNIKLINLNNHCSLAQRLLRRTLKHHFFTPSLFIGRKLRKTLASLTNEDSLLVIDYTNINLIYSISKLTPLVVKKFLWIWNPLNPSKENILKGKISYIKDRKFEICTFDSNDAEKYKLVLLKQFYRILPVDKNNNYIDKYDFYFLGFEKNRTNIINDLRVKLKSYKLLFHIVSEQNQVISYAKNIENIKSSKCIVDLVQDNQKGITLRPLEAIAFGKKLITNNKNIIKEEIYNPNNIFVICLDDFNKLDEFMSQGLIDIDLDVLSNYDINTWIDYFN